jgi:hypothetical protein
MLRNILLVEDDPRDVELTVAAMDERLLDTGKDSLITDCPDWVKIPLLGILEWMSEQNTAGSLTGKEIRKASN